MTMSPTQLIHPAAVILELILRPYSLSCNTQSIGVNVLTIRNRVYSCFSNSAQLSTSPSSSCSKQYCNVNICAILINSDKIGVYYIELLNRYTVLPQTCSSPMTVR